MQTPGFQTIHFYFYVEMSANIRFHVDSETKLKLIPHLRVVPYNKSRNEYLLVHTYYTKPKKDDELNRMHYMIVKFVLCDAAVKCFNDYIDSFEDRIPLSVLTTYDSKEGKGVIREELKEYFTLLSTDMYICYKRD